jgi:hypothetical protein
MGILQLPGQPLGASPAAAAQATDQRASTRGAVDLAPSSPRYLAVTRTLFTIFCRSSTVDDCGYVMPPPARRWPNHEVTA